MSEYIMECKTDFDGVDCYIKTGEVVRCKDCTRFDPRRGCNLVEGLNIAKADSFCSYGERKTDE